jgi:hypothetical protein
VRPQFNRTNSITIFIENNQEDEDETAVSSVRFLGNTTAGTKSLGYALQPGNTGGGMSAMGPPLG